MLHVGLLIGPRRLVRHVGDVERPAIGTNGRPLAEAVRVGERRATSEKPTMARKSLGKWVVMRAWRATATFLAARKLSRIGIDSDRSSMSTVAERERCSICSTSKSSGLRRTGVPAP